MDLRRERKRGNTIIGILLLLIFIALFATFYILQSKSQALPTSAQNVYEDVDERSTPLKKSIFASTTSKNKPDEFSYSIERTIHIDDNNEAKVSIENPSKNLYLMVVELVISQDETVVLRTGYIAPGYKIENASFDIPISTGTHDATAVFYAIDPQSRDILGMLEQPITITMK